MDFSEVYKQTVNGSCCFSPNGKLLASILSFRVIVRDAETLEIINLFNFIDKIDKICWNGTSNLIACASLKLATIQVWEISSSDTPWTCRIDEVFHKNNCTVVCIFQQTQTFLKKNPSLFRGSLAWLGWCLILLEEIWSRFQTSKLVILIVST